GELAFTSGRVLHPATGAPIPKARFSVVGHDHLKFLDPPLAALGAIQFYDCDKLATLEHKLIQTLQKRASSLTNIAQRLRALRIEATVDHDRLAVRAVVQTTAHAFELLGGPDGIRVSRVAPVGGKPLEVPANFPPLVLEQHPTSTDLELYL